MSENSSLRLASYNIRAGLGMDLRRDPMRVLDTIAELGADIIALQEADFRTGQRPTALPRDAIFERTGLVPLPVAANNVSLGWHGIAILARPDLIAQSVHRYALPGLEPRGAVAVDFPDLRVVGVHLGLLRRSRRAQLDRIRHELNALAPRPTIILGDFNEWSGKVGLGRLAAHYKILTPDRTFPAGVPLGALDRIAHCDQLNVCLLDVDRHRGIRHASDHLPILATVMHT